MDMTILDLAFVLAAAACLGGALVAVTRRNPIYSALWLLVALLGVASVFACYAATFLALMQVVIYAGAVLVLFLFVIVMLNLRAEDLPPEPSRAGKAVAAIVALAFFGVMAAGILGATGGPERMAPADLAGHDFGSMPSVGRSLFTHHVVPFEALSFLIVTALLGAVLLAKRKY